MLRKPRPRKNENIRTSLRDVGDVGWVELA